MFKSQPPQYVSLFNLTPANDSQTDTLPSPRAFVQHPQLDANGIFIRQGWLPARPGSYEGRFWSLRTRLSLAWRVFKGELDALDWHQERGAAK